MIIIVIVSAVVVVAAVVSLLHSFPFFLFFFWVCFLNILQLSHVHPSVMHTFLIVSPFIHASIHDLHAPLLCLFFLLLLLLHSSSYLKFLCVCVFSPAFIFCWFSFFFTLLATFRLIKDNSVIIIVFSLPFLLLLYSAVYVWVFRLFVFVSPLFMVYYKKLSHCLLLCFNFITSPLLYHFYSKYTTWFYLLYYASRIQLSAFFCTQY